MQKKSRKIRNLVIGSLAFIFLANYSYKLVHGDKKARQILNNHLDSIMHTENVVAHRGFSSLFPDNSKESIMSALNSPCVDMIEIDIQRTKNAKTILEHNSSIFLSDFLINIKDLDLDDLSEDFEIAGYSLCNFDDFFHEDAIFLYKRYFQKNYVTTSLFLLEDFIAWYDFSKPLILDLKIDEVDTLWMQELNLIFLPYQDKIFFQSSYYPFLEKMQELYPNYKYLYIIDSKANLQNINNNFTGYTVKYSLLNYLEIDPEKMYFIYTINSSKTYLDLINQKNYQSNFYIITDNPDYICALNDSKKLRK